VSRRRLKILLAYLLIPPSCLAPGQPSLSAHFSVKLTNEGLSQHEDCRRQPPLAPPEFNGGSIPVPAFDIFFSGTF
jgi:hypothetical protein